jgi:hypothetical protein
MITVEGALPWRAGGEHRRALHVQLGEQPDPADPMIGVMDTAELAAVVVRTRAALARLVLLKDGPRDQRYDTDRTEAWNEARAVIGVQVRLPAEP